MNKKIAIGRQGPKPCVVVGMDRASATRVKWEFMKDSKGVFDTHQLSLGTPNFDKLIVGAPAKLPCDVWI